MRDKRRPYTVSTCTPSRLAHYVVARLADTYQFVESRRQGIALAVPTTTPSKCWSVGQLRQFLVLLPLSLLPVVGFAQSLQPFSAATSEALPPPWRVVGLPKGKAPLTTIDIVTLDGVRVLRLASDKSYGTALHELTPVVPGRGSTLRWRWRLDQPLPGADLRRKDADDSPLKVCAMFDMSLDKLGFLERSVLRLARGLSAEKLPAATLCYVWDHRLPVGTQLPNAYSPRVHYVVLDSGDIELRHWRTHEQDIAADFQKAFGHETDVMPPLVAIVVGADADNTHGTSLAYLGDLTLSLTTAMNATVAIPAPSANVKP